MRDQRYLEAKLLVSYGGPQDSPRDSAEGPPQDWSRDRPKDLPQDLPKDLLKDLPRDLPKDRIVQMLRRALTDVDPDVNMAITPIEQNVISALAPVRIAAAAASALGALGLLLGCTGLYGVVAFSVGRRRREIGIRMALGARRLHVLRTVVGQGLIPVLAGSIVGLALAAASARLLRALLFGVSPLDPVALGATMLGLTAAAALATLLPARAALRVDPAVTLRHE